MRVNRRVFFLANLYSDEVLNVKIAYADKIIGPPAKSMSESERRSLQMYESSHNGFFQQKTARHNSVDKFTGGF